MIKMFSLSFAGKLQKDYFLSHIGGLLRISIMSIKDSRYRGSFNEQNALMISNRLRLTPCSGPTNTSRYVIPNKGISTKRALAAFRYCLVSNVLAERNFVIST
uniref:Uncharacterized protein n=1 Tax=Glossina pallidipes TaxID=7398 RepID=A0A1B0A4Q6_GLOPL